MGRRLPDEVVHRIRLRVEANESVAAIAEAVKVSKKTIYKLRLNLDIWGEPYAPPTVTLGRHRSLLPYQEMKLLKFLEDQPTAYLDEMQTFLFDEFDALLSLTSIYRALERARWSRKVVKAQAAERSTTLRNAWIGIQKSWTVD